ncbi:MAG TPA: toll/interleukin-1 receptor domain-containing protein [Candidatus Binatia bacterium]|jgi:hypothetical protein|nr:toll/interleukin-1 receptor domain-containing protein [Candidatus Binatia bacterium]
MRTTPLNSVFWDRLLGFIGDRKVIPVVGPELSTIEVGGVSVPLVVHLAERLADYLGVAPSEDGPADLNDVACRYLADRRGDLQDIYSGLKVVMPPDEDLAIPPALSKLAQIEPFRLFVSTAFDTLLERAINATRFDGQPRTESYSYSPQRIEDIPAELARLRDPVVFQLMGRISASPEYAVTEEDSLEFIHALQSETRRPRLLFDELTRHHLLILGSALPEWLARFFIRIAKRERLWLARLKTDIVVDSRTSRSESLVRFLSAFNEQTKVLPAPEVSGFVDELHARWMQWSERHPRLGSGAVALPAGKPMEQGAVFLSYASEDIAAVRSLQTVLEKAGIPVWFDKAEYGDSGAEERRLRAGDAYESRIKRSIENAAVFVPVISRHALTRMPRFFRIEWRHAEHVADQLPSGSRFILPVVIDDTAYTEELLPPAFRALHWTRFDGETSDVEIFAAALRELVREHHRALLHGAA